MSDELVNTDNFKLPNEDDLNLLVNTMYKTSDDVSSIANILCDQCTSSLDDYVKFISDSLRQPINISNDTLDSFILNLPIYIYYASSAIELLGIREDVSELVKKRKISEVITKLKDNKSGTAAQRNATAESICSQDILVNNIFSTAYKMGKSKIDYAYEILASCKKVMSRRIEELKAFNSDTHRNNPQI